MKENSVFGFKKGMTLDDINSVSTHEAIKANEHAKQLFEVFPKQIELEGFNKYHIKLNDDSTIEKLRLLVYDIEESDLPKKLDSVFQTVSNKYGIYDSTLSDDVSIFFYDSIELMKVLNEKPEGLKYIWNKYILTEYKTIISKITLTVKPDNNNTGFICVEFTFDDSNIDTKETFNNTPADINLLDGDDQDTIYENETSYKEDNVIPSSEEKILITTEEKPIEKNEQTDSIEYENRGSNNPKTEIPKAEYVQSSKKFKISKLNLVWYSLMLFVWIGFLWEPIKCTFDNKQKGVWINIIYYAIYFGYTVLACCLPFIIKTFLNKFVKTELKERHALLTGEKIETKEHSIWAAYKSTFFNKDFGITNKTRASADLYFNYESVANTMMSDFPVTSSFKMIASSFMGLGILGTFIGFAIGLRNIDFSSTNTKVMLNGIESLVKNGLATAFNTSIVGVFCSLIYSFLIYNPLLLKLNKYFEQLSDSLDQEFFVSETEALMQYTMLTDENAQNITFSQSLRFIVENMNKQTDALNNFNDNLADKIANMNETVNTTLGKIVTGLGTEVKDAVIENMHTEMNGLKLSLSDAAKQLGLVADKISNTPELLSKANNELKTYLDDTRSSFSEMLDQNIQTNRTVLNEIVETIRNELSNKFSEFNNSLTQALSNCQKATELLANVPDKLEYFKVIGNNLAGVAKDLTSAEDNIKELLASAKMNEDNSGKNLGTVIDETNRMLEGFKAVDINLKNIFESIGNEIVKYNTTIDSTLKQYLSSFEDGSKSFSTAIHGSMQEFEDTLSDLSTNIANIQQTAKSFDASIAKLEVTLSQNKHGEKKDNK
ncbi:MAG: methyl-accepting chemotaxis protein [Treponema sp.]|nr:methyl-accepting chemotaxis protein [Treponema sp.]